jgi:DNA modification methylase
MGESEKPPWPADQIERRALSTLIPYARNARKHSDAQVAEIAGSIREWGWTIPALIDEEGRIIAGHGRVMAAHKLGLEEIPVMVARGWTDAQKQAYTLADNQIALHGTWDLELLRVELVDLRDQAVDLATLGFTLDDVRAFAGRDDAVADEVPPTPEPGKVKTKPGDVWTLGRHRLVCGDAADPAIVAKLMRDETAAVCFTSPPYAQQRIYGGLAAAALARIPASALAGDWSAMMGGVCDAMPLAPDGQLLVNLGLVHRDNEWVPYWDEWIAAMRAKGWRRFAWYVWDQGPGMPGNWNGRLAPSFEFVFHFNRASRQVRKTKQKIAIDVRQRTILRDAKDAKKVITNAAASAQPTKIPDAIIRVMRAKGPLAGGLDHPAVFPVALVEEMLTAFSEEGAIVYEPFAGSGTQIIAAERLKRTCYAVEIEPAYCDVVVERWRRVTGQDAKREAKRHGRAAA